MPNQSYSKTYTLNKIAELFADNVNNEISPLDNRTIAELLLNIGTGGTAKPINIVGGVTASPLPVTITLLSNGSVVNGVTLSTGDNLLVPNQTDPTENGIYVIGANPGETVRADDFPDAASINGVIVVVDTPISGQGNLFVATTSGDNITFNTPAQIATGEITDAALIAEITDEANWANKYYNGSTDGLNHGDWYVDENYFIEYYVKNISGTLKVFRANLNTV